MQSTRTLALALVATVGGMTAAVVAIGLALDHTRSDSAPAPAHTTDDASVTAPTTGIVAHTFPESTVIHLSGEIDAARLDEARGALAALEAAEPGLPVLLDARDVTFMDSTGVALVDQVRRACLATGAPVLLVDPPATVTDVLALAGVGDTVPVVGGHGGWGP
ncbi:STAS domain-containing protein [Cellulosimicrobium cellulans]|uniref:STAS domain-containing protein n=1 Tax=Cellulosimicrobium cellulans TaxID=1710 RepID=UPI00365B5F91